MPGTGRLELTFADVTGAPISDIAEIRLRHHTRGDQRRVDRHDTSRQLVITDLRTDPQGLYVLEVHARCYWPVQRFVTIPADGRGRATVTLPIRPNRARATFPPYDQLDPRVQGVLERSDSVKGHEGRTGRDLYAVLSPEAKAGLLNIAKKTLATPFRNGEDLLTHVKVLEIKGDRCIVDLPAGVKEQMDELVDQQLFRSVDGALHDPPVERFVPAGSFKTMDAFGNLQLTFFTCDDRCVADVDIDDAAGLGHVFQVLRNHITDSPTHPYNIHQILVAHQHLDPGYHLSPEPV